MIVRTYGRRKLGGGISKSYLDDDDNDDDDDVVVLGNCRDSLSSQEAAPADIFAFSSQDSAYFDLGSFPSDGVFRQPKRQRKREVGNANSSDSGYVDYSVLRATSTLMETQEFGEMMEHVDEVNFALDGLRKGQPARIRRASLLSLLGICGTSPRRRLLRSHGMVKSIIDAIMGLSFDDSLSNLAAATLFYILISDVQDEQLLESPSCIRFLIKLLKPVTSAPNEGKLPRIGSKLLRVRNDADVPRGTSSKSDRTSVSMLTRVKEILGSCKELESVFGDDCALDRPELSPKWVALLTLEKASVSTISLEESSGIVRKTGGNFREKLREFGGLDAVFEVAMHCHSIMEGLKDSGSSSIRDDREGTLLESLLLLLKCLKIMENATFLSKDNQDYLLKMQGKSGCEGHHVTFTKLVLNLIQILLGLSLHKSSSAATHDNKSNSAQGIASEFDLVPEDKADEVFCIQSFKERCSMEESSTQRSSDYFQDNHLLSSAPSRCSSFSEMKTSLVNGSFSFKSSMSAASDSCGEMSKDSGNRSSLMSNDFKNFSSDKRCGWSGSSACDLSEDTQDPYAFDEYEFEPSKWEVLSGKKRSSRTENCMLSAGEAENMIQLQQMRNKDSEYPLQASNACKSHQSQEASCSGSTDEESSSLLADCLLTAVKVLMNLTNDNVVGCRQIAACGGLEAMASIIAAHFPTFHSSIAPSPLFSPCEIEEYGVPIEFDHQKDNHLTDQELDFLVAILGLLVNLVEKDENNRYRLARTNITLYDSKGSDSKSQKEVVPLLCSIFLANKGDSEMAGEESDQPWDPETIMEQGEKEAEKMIVEAYAALLLAFLSTESKRTRDVIADCLPDHNLAILVPVLERFVAFHLTLDMMTPETHKAVSEVIESCRIP